MWQGESIIIVSSPIRKSGSRGVPKRGRDLGECETDFNISNSDQF